MTKIKGLMNHMENLKRDKIIVKEELKMINKEISDIQDKLDSKLQSHQTKPYTRLEPCTREGKQLGKGVAKTGDAFSIKEVQEVKKK